MPRWGFRSATDVLTRGPTVTLARIADKFGVQLATIARARIDTLNRRSAPRNWEGLISEMARAHAEELELHAKKLRKMARELVESSSKS